MNLSETLHIITESLGYILPEICLAIGAMFILIIELIKPSEQKRFKTILHFVILIATLLLVNTTPYSSSFGGIIKIDSLANFFKNMFLMVVAASLLFPKVKDDIRNRGEYHFLLLALLLGTFLVIQSTNLLVFYLSLELISISSYILTTFSFNKRGY